MAWFKVGQCNLLQTKGWGGVGGGKCIQRFLENQIHLHRKWDWPSLFWYIFIDLCTVQYFWGSSLHATIRDWAADQDSLKTLQRAVSLFNSLHDIWKILRSDITRVAPNSMFIYQMSESFEGEKLMTNRHLWDLRCLLLLINCLHIAWHYVNFWFTVHSFCLVIGRSECSTRMLLLDLKLHLLCTNTCSLTWGSGTLTYHLVKDQLNHSLTS